MSGPWGVWDDCPADYGMYIDAEAFPTYREAADEVRSWLSTIDEHHLYPGSAKRIRKALCDGGPDGWCEGSCPEDEGSHRVEHEVWGFTLRARRGMECGDPPPRWNGA